MRMTARFLGAESQTAETVCFVLMVCRRRAAARIGVGFIAAVVRLCLNGALTIAAHTDEVRGAYGS